MSDAAAGDAGKFDIAAVVKTVVDSVSTKFQTQFDEMAKNQKVLGDTIVEQGKLLAAAKTAPAGDAKPLSAEDVARITAETLDKRDQTKQQSADQSATRKAFIDSDKSGLKKLPKAFQDKLGSDPAKYEVEASAIVGDWHAFVKDNNIIVPDVGGAAREGGETAANTGKPAADRYSFIKMPNATPAAQAAATK